MKVTLNLVDIYNIVAENDKDKKIEIAANILFNSLHSMMAICDDEKEIANELFYNITALLSDLSHISVRELAENFIKKSSDKRM